MLYEMKNKAYHKQNRTKRFINECKCILKK